MAYRKLHHGDQVRIRGKGVNHSGRNAIVIHSANECHTRVQIVPWGSFPDEKTICVTLHNDNLMVRHEPHGWIIDGRIDHDKKEAFEKLARDREKFNTIEDHEDDEFEFYDRDDLIDIIVKLRNDVSTLNDSVVDLEMKLEGF